MSKDPGPGPHPNPNELLERIVAAEEPQRRGHLKIFLGYSAGVGKTYTMLEAGNQRKKEVDLAVAYVETHGRTETQALVKGLEIIPPRQTEYKGLILSEMDLDAVLKRRPQLALVDELAHTNISDSRHLKRYQDVEELLDAGIDVYTTLNVQHIESLRDVVAQITGIWMRETVPDQLVSSANEIEIIDIPPEELLKRLKEGKVYVPDQIAQATAKFFRKGNLTALRELTMRVAAQHVDQQKQSYMRDHAIPGPWFTSEQILVVLGPYSSEALVRHAHRLAQQLSAEWFVINIETPDDSRLSPGQRDNIADNLRLADRMGAKIAIIQANSVPESVIDFARKNAVTKIVLGKSPSGFWRNLFGASIESRILRLTRYSDVLIFNDNDKQSKVEKPSNSAARNWLGYLPGAVLVALVTLICQLWSGSLNSATITLIYFLCFVFTALFWGFGPSIFVSVLSVLALVFFFIFPSQSTPSRELIVTLMVALTVGVIFSYLLARFRQQTAAARYREQETAALYALSKDLTVSNDLESYLRTIIKRTKETFGQEVALFLPDGKGSGMLKPYAKSTEINIDEKEAAAALWSFEHQKVVGHNTETLPYAKARYLPLVTARRTVGVIGLWPSDPETSLTINQEKLLSAYIDLEALAIEGIMTFEESDTGRIVRASDALQTAFLNSISHDLRTPLVSIFETLNNLTEGSANLDETVKKSLDRINEEAGILNHMITNLIDQSRIDSGALRLTPVLAKIPDIIAVALEQSGVDAEKRRVKTDFPSDLPLISVDFGLIVQALANILDNAIRYSPPDIPVEVNARKIGKEVEIAVADGGIGIPPQDLTRVFDKFFRVHRPSKVEGTGLGLSISKGYVDAHGGRIRAENRPGGGTIITVVLPVGTEAAVNNRTVVESDPKKI